MTARDAFCRIVFRMAPFGDFAQASGRAESQRVVVEAVWTTSPQHAGVLTAHVSAFTRW